MLPVLLDGDDDSSGQLDDLENCCEALTEIALLETRFISCRSSTIALASVVKAARLHNLSEASILTFLERMSQAIGRDDVAYRQVYQHLEHVYDQ